MRSNSASPTSSNGWLRCVTPALLTTMSMPPKASVAVRTMASTSIFLRHVALHGMILSPKPAASSRTPWPLMSAATTLAPSSTNRSAMARPNPEAAPVTIATLPASFMSTSLQRRRRTGILPSAARRAASAR